jgi:type II secretory pathway pseudopilin PulG
MKDKGFTIIELLVSLGIAILVFGILATAYLATQRIWKKGFSQITIQSQARTALSKITRAIMPAIDATILDNGNRIRFVTDPNRTISVTADDITCDYYIAGTTIMYDPNTSVSGNEVLLLRNVYKEGTIPYFQLSGNLAVITFKVSVSDALYGSALVHITGSTKIRNKK